MSEKSGELKPTTPGLNDIRHAQVIAKYGEIQLKNRSIMEDQVNKKIASFFNRNADISKKYLRKTFDSLDVPLASKKGVNAGGDHTLPNPPQLRQLSPLSTKIAESPP
jgi:hypothetical protein